MTFLMYDTGASCGKHNINRVLKRGWHIIRKEKTECFESRAAIGVPFLWIISLQRLSLWIYSLGEPNVVLIWFTSQTSVCWLITIPAWRSSGGILSYPRVRRKQNMWLVSWGMCAAWEAGLANAISSPQIAFLDICY